MAIPTSRIVTSQGVIHVMQSSGQGLPIIMLHGTGATSAAFQRQFAAPMADTNRLVALDFLGHGKSSDATDPERAYTYEGLAKSVGEVIDGLKIERAVVFGWSLGGHAAIDLMTWHPAVAGVVLTGTPPIQRGPLGILRGFHFGIDNLLASKPNFTDSEAQRFLTLCYGKDAPAEFLEGIKRADGRLRKIVFSAMMRGHGIDQKRAVQDTSVPVAIINGSNEPIARLSYVAGLNYGNLWEGRCHIIEGAGHAPFFTKADEFNALLARFARDVALSDARRVPQKTYAAAG